MAILKYSFSSDKPQKVSNLKCHWNGKTENHIYTGLTGLCIDENSTWKYFFLKMVTSVWAKFQSQILEIVSIKTAHFFFEKNTHFSQII